MSESGLLEGHLPCANYLENLVADLLLNPAELDLNAQAVLLAEIEPVVTVAENAMLLAPPDKDEVFETLKDANHGAAPGTDGVQVVLGLHGGCARSSSRGQV